MRRWGEKRSRRTPLPQRRCDSQPLRKAIQNSRRTCTTKKEKVSRSTEQTRKAGECVRYKYSDTLRIQTSTSVKCLALACDGDER